MLDGDDDTLRVNSGFIASDTTISSGGYVYVSSGGRLKDAMIYQGGWADAEEGAEVSNAVIQGLDLDQSYIDIRSGFIASETTLKDFACIYVSSGGSAVKTTVMSGGQLVVSSGGTVIDASSSSRSSSRSEGCSGLRTQPHSSRARARSRRIARLMTSSNP